MERVIQCFGLLNRKLNFFSLPTTSTVLFQKLAFLKKKIISFFYKFVWSAEESRAAKLTRSF